MKIVIDLEGVRGTIKYFNAPDSFYCIENSEGRKYFYEKIQFHKARATNVK